MLNTTLLHPEILEILARGGHHSLILIADGNYPATTKRGPNSTVVPLQLMPDVPTVAEVFQAILGSIQIDSVQTMGVDRDPPMLQRLRATHRFGKNTEVFFKLLEVVAFWSLF